MKTFWKTFFYWLIVGTIVVVCIGFIRGEYRTMLLEVPIVIVLSLVFASVRLIDDYYKAK